MDIVTSINPFFVRTGHFCVENRDRYHFLPQKERNRSSRSSKARPPDLKSDVPLTETTVELALEFIPSIAVETLLVLLHVGAESLQLPSLWHTRVRFPVRRL